jgi:hypothetical protein
MVTLPFSSWETTRQVLCSACKPSKRGKRKTGEEHYGPHPQILKRLAEAYHVPASELMQRAGYIEGKDEEGGFSESREGEL